MIKYFLIILLITHVLCDFYFQSPKMAKNKRDRLLWVFIHAFVYSIGAFAILAFVTPGLEWKYLLGFAMGHAVIDLAKYLICNSKYMGKVSFVKKEQNIFISDQILHILLILALTYLIKDFNPNSMYNVRLKELFDIFNVSETLVLSWMIKILLIHKPANILIANILSQYRPNQKGTQGLQDKNAGRFIGTLERIIMVVLMSINQYSAVGLVLTAKSIARYDKISKDQEFAEYYLLGTLLSTLYAIGVSILF